ncbi:MAG: helix-turn-helix transcriptional regulator [Bacillota bacterium]
MDKKSLYVQLGRNLKRARAKSGFTQSQVAKLLGIPREVISYFESGTREPGMDDVIRLADIYGVNMRYLLPESEAACEIEPVGDTSISLAFRAGRIVEEDLPVIVESRRFLNNLFELNKLLEGENPECR